MNSHRPTTIKTVFYYLNRLEEIFLCFLLCAMIGLACVQIILRDFFSSGFVWADPLLRYIVLWAGLFGAGLATKNNKHIAIDIISYLVPQKMMPWLSGLVHLFSALVCIAITYASIVFISNEIAYPGSSEILSVPSWVMNLAFPLAFGLISLRFIILLITDLVTISKAFKSSSSSSPQIG